MPYEGKVIRAATERLNEDARRNRSACERRRSQIYTAVPRLEEIDRQLSRTVRLAAQAALQQGIDPGPALEEAKRWNLSLQQERDSLLIGGGWQKGDLTYKPLCPLCGDRGWRGSEMCRCLQAYCGQEQIRDLSSMLNLGDQSFDTFDLDYYSPLYDATIGGSPRSWMEMALDVCYTFADKFGRNSVKNLLLTGEPGLGKTFLSAAIARVVSERGYSVVYDSAVNVFARFEAQRSRFGQSKAHALLRSDDPGRPGQRDEFPSGPDRPLPAHQRQAAGRQADGHLLQPVSGRYGPEIHSPDLLKTGRRIF